MELDAALALLKAVPVARDIDGQPWHMPLEGQHVFVAGRTGSGKNSITWSLVLRLAPAWKVGLVRYWGIDPKRIELAIGRGFWDYYADTDEGMVELLELCVHDMQQRMTAMQGVSRRFTPSPTTPLNVIIIDEMAYLSFYMADKKLRERADKAVRTILTQGRAPGYAVVGAVQDPRIETCGYRNMFPLRIAGGLNEARQVDMVLGEGMHEAGANCELIPFTEPGVSHYTGMSTCGSGWICPVCSSKIRYHRANEVSRAVVSALDQGMSALFVTRTLPHSAEDRLGVTLNLLAEGRRYVANQTVVKGTRRSAAYIGGISAKELTYGSNGWHPHTHDIEYYERELALEDFAALSSVYYDYLSRFYSRNGFEGLTRRHGVRVEQVQLDGVALARYVAKLQEGTTIRLHTAHELTRADLKQGRAGALMPFDLATEFFVTGDMALLDLWHEFERETFGRSVIRFTKGLRALLLPKEVEQTDEELAALEVGGVDAVRFAGWFYRKIARIPGLEGKILTALDTGGFAALVELLTVYHLDNENGYYQIEATSESESEE